MNKGKKGLAVFLLCLTLLPCVLLGAAAEGMPQISITANDVEVVVGSTITMRADITGVSGKPPLRWQSSDPAVASVDANGVVTGKSVGRATITVTAQTGERQIKDSMVIYVIKSRVSLKRLLESGQILGYKYSFRDDYYYTNDKQCWQSNFGFSRFYDLVAPFVLLEYDYVRICFTYQGKDWMIQLWKGQYGLIFYGAEQGVYTKPHSDKEDGVFTFYRCADPGDWLKMEMTMYHDKTGNGSYVREFTRDYDTYWWCTGFKPGHLRQQEPATELRTAGTITLKDAEMTGLFTEGLRQCGFTEANDEKSLMHDQFFVSGNSVRFIWQDINDAETTMPIKRTYYAFAGFFAFFIGIFAFMLMAFLGLSLIVIIL